MSEKHADDPSAAKPEQRFKGKGAMNASEASAVCLVCHEGQNTRSCCCGPAAPTAGGRGMHQLPHGPRQQGPGLQQGRAVRCVLRVPQGHAVAMNKPWRHPVQEGKMSCSDCHSPHGSAGPKLAKRDTINATCYQCHAEKRGPYVHNHQPVQDNCASCHNPHGSNVAAMLTARDPILCNQCHVPHAVGGIGAVRGQPGVLPPAVPPQTQSAVTPLSGGINTVNIWQGRSCLNCTRRSTARTIRRRGRRRRRTCSAEHRSDAMTQQQRVREFSRTALALAVLAAFTSVQAQDKKEEEKKNPVETEITLEGGAAYVSGDAADRAFWGQYNGMRNKDVYGIANFDYSRRDTSTGTWLDVYGSNSAADARTWGVLDAAGRVEAQRELRRTVARESVHGELRHQRVGDRAARELPCGRPRQR